MPSYVHTGIRFPASANCCNGRCGNGGFGRWPRLRSERAGLLAHEEGTKLGVAVPDAKEDAQPDREEVGRDNGDAGGAF